MLNKLYAGLAALGAIVLALLGAVYHGKRVAMLQFKDKHAKAKEKKSKEIQQATEKAIIKAKESHEKSKKLGRNYWDTYNKRLRDRQNLR